MDSELVIRENLRVGFIWQRHSFGPYVSVGRLYDNTETALRKSFVVVKYEYNSGRSIEEERKALRSFLFQTDVILGLNSRLLEVRKEEKINVPFCFFPLGVMPKGGSVLFSWRTLLRETDSILFSSAADREIFDRMVKNSRIKTYIVPFGVDCSLFKPIPQSDNLYTRKRIGIPDNAPLLLYVGRINVQKNIHTLLKMFREIVRKEDSARLCLVGQQDDVQFHEFGLTNEGYDKYLKELIDRYNLNRKVIMTGQLDGGNLVSMYSAADILVNCTIHHDENFGYSQVEAMACGTPVVCSKWGGLKDTVVHGETGFHMDTLMTNNGVKADWSSGVEYILYLLNDKPLLKRMSKRCVEYARDKFGIEAFTKSLAKVIEDMYTEKRKWNPANMNPAFEFTHSAVNFHMHRLYVNYLDKTSGGKCRSPMFSGDNYELYKFIMEPYASKTVYRMTCINDVDIPYFLTDVTFDKNTTTLYVIDPIWPRTYELERWEFSTLSQISFSISSVIMISKL